MRTVDAPFAPSVRASATTRRDLRRRLRRHDVLSRRLAELSAIETLLTRAAAVLGSGWVQDAWFSVSTDAGPRPVTVHDLPAATRHPVVGACLVGAVVQAAGGPATVRTQLVQRTLEVTWHALREEADRPVRWCPGPVVRRMHVLDLTRWNDAAGRTRAEVADLVQTARLVTAVQGDLCRAEQAALAGR